MNTSKVELVVNGSSQRLELDPRTSLLDALREHMQLTGTKKGCNQGACGACTVFASYGNPDIAQVGRYLDELLAGLLSALHAPVPAELATR
jgi:xanthine dehydrogenase iron-sulfur cluster and FAD-binding subunit A